MVKQKKNKDINSTILQKEEHVSVDKIDKPIQSTSSQPPVESSITSIASSNKDIPVKIPVVSPITKSKKLSLDIVDESLKKQAAASTQTISTSSTKEPIPIDILLFEQKWKAFVEEVKIKYENLGLAMSLEQANYLVEHHIITIQVNSETTKELVENDKSLLIDYLSKELNNDTINVIIRVSDKAFEINKKSLSPNDKLKVMVENNPAVAELIKLLNLEIDY